MWIKSLSGIAALVLCAANGALADGRHHGHTEYDYGRVIDVQPIVREVAVTRPRQECWDEVVREAAAPYGIAGPTIAGGVVGAAIGRQFGSGEDRDALTLIGAVLGSAVANQRAVRNQAYRDIVVERCEVVNERFTEERVEGYRVTYEYRGRTYATTMAAPPGDRIRLAVEVRPVAG